MATVIRSAQISGDAVTLAVLGGTAPRVPAQVAVPEAPAIPDEAVASHDSAVAQLRERERQLQERERLIREELEAEFKRVRDAAYAEGYQNGETEAVRLHGARLDALQNLIESFRKEFAGQISGLEDVVVGIAFEAVCKIVGKALLGREGVQAVVQEVMARVKGQEKLVLRVSPQDYELLQQDRSGVSAAVHGASHELMSDDRVVFGGCMVETSGGTLDGRIETQLQQLREALVSARKMLPE